MKIIGLVGGVSWLSSVDYYRHLNESVSRELGGLNGARCVLYSLNFADMKLLNDRQDWPTMLAVVDEVCQRLTGAGADCIVLCANTLHVIADDLRPRLPVPLIHIAESTAAAIEARGLRTVGLLGTKFTMEMEFFTKKLQARGIGVRIPPGPDRDYLHASIFEELGRGLFTADTRRRYLAIIDGLVAHGAEGIVLGCTEIPLLVMQKDCRVPLFDTVAIHAATAAAFALDRS